MSTDFNVKFILLLATFWGLSGCEVDTKGDDNSENKIPAESETVIINDDYTAVKAGDYWGVVDNNYNYYIEPQFSEFNSDSLTVKRNGVNWNLNIEDRTLGLAYQFELIQKFSEGYAAFKTEEGWGYISTGGQVLVEPQYWGANLFSEGLAAVGRDGGWGYINTFGEMVIDPKYDDVTQFSAGFASVMHDNKWGVIDTSGSELIAPKYDDLILFKNGAIAVEEGELWRFIDIYDNELFGGKFDYIYPLTNEEGLYSVVRDGSWQLINSSGVAISTKSYNTSFYFFEDALLAVEDEELWGFINSKGEEIVEPQYIQVAPFSGGYAAVYKNDGWGYINTSGEMIISPQFERPSSFNDGMAFVKAQEGDWGVIDINGGYVVEPQYGWIMGVENGLVIAREKGSDFGWGIIDLDGNIIVDHKYASIYGPEEGYYRAQTLEGYSFIGEDGNLITVEL